MMGYWFKSLFYGMVALAALLPFVAQAQGLSGRGAGMETDAAVTRQCDIDYRDLRGNISQLIQRVNRLLSCNNQGQTYDPDAGGDGCIALPVGPEHSWSNTVLSFKNESGVLVPGRDLQGPQGDPGANIACYPAGIPTTSTSSSSGSCDPWTTGGWSSCADGLQTRSVNCPSGNCCSPQPANSQPCIPSSSTSSSGGGTWQESRSDCTANPSWSTDPWGNCSVGCGGGTQNRNVNCINNSGTLVVSYTCSTSSGCFETRPPNHTENCTVSCNINNRPAGTQSCNTHSCPSSSGGPGNCECVAQGPVRCSNLFGSGPMQGGSCDHMTGGPNNPHDYYIPCGGQCIRCAQHPYLICH